MPCPPDVPREFWDYEELRDSLTRERHIGHAVRRYRHHPHHGRTPIPVSMAAQWFNISQPQLSRIEAGRRIDDLGRLVQWAQILRIPQDLLWFALPGKSLKSNNPEEGFPQEWTGREVRALRESLGMNPREFGSRLSVSDRAVSQWESRAGETIPREDKNSVLNKILGRASDDARARFQQFLMAEAWVYSHMGNEVKTDRAVDRAIQLFPQSDSGSHAQISLIRAFARIRSGDVSEGVRHACAVYETLIPEQCTTMVDTLAQRVLDSVPAEAGRRSDVAEYRALLASKPKKMIES
jgi:transcriptional regulator with XRE-family HTH domain